MIAFDATGPLPTGTTVLQASAGTGKTYAIAALAARYLAEGRVTVGGLAVISFSRVASDELRSRVRQRLRDTANVLRDRRAGIDAPGLDATDALLADGTGDELALREQRLRTAISGLDAAGIMTIHQFCEAMFDELGVLAVEDPGAVLVEDLSDLRRQVVDDLYLARYAADDREPPFDLATAQQLGRGAVDHPDLALVPAAAQGVAGERIRFAEEVRRMFAERKRRLGVYSYDDQLIRLRDSLRASAPLGARRLRRRCEVVLVDEFQDTDPVQWEILRDAFDGHVPLVLIGDPKQSIYAFRGADVAAYAEAVAAAPQRYSLAVNFRADAAVVTGITGLFGSTRLGPGIQVDPVTAEHAGRRLRGPAAPEPVSLRWVDAAARLPRADARRRVDADLVAEVTGMLAGRAEFDDGDGWRPLAAHDLAVLVSTNERGREVAAALAAAGVPVAFSGADSIFASSAAADWLALLRALDQPRRAAVRAAILTDFVGADLDALARADDAQLSSWSALLQGWARLLAGQGVAALFAAVQAGSPETDAGLAERLLHRRRGERDLTDHRQLAELLHARHSAGVRGPELVTWLAEQIDGVGEVADRTRRLETDREAVQVMTVHKAKGLQFPVVLLPEAAETQVSDLDSGRNLDVHEPDGRRVLDLAGLGAPGRNERFEAAAAEEAEDRLRALYVAATRAQCSVVLWWAPTWYHTAASPLHRLLFRDRDRPGVPQQGYDVDHCSPGDLGWLAGAGISARTCDPDPTPTAVARPGQPARLAAPVWSRRVDPLWRRTSYSGLTEAVHARPPVALTALPVTADEPFGDVQPTAAGPGRTPSPMGDMPGGTSFGSLVHEVLEHLDWHAPDQDALTARIREATTAAFGRYPVAGVSPALLAEALEPSLLTPLGRLTGGRALADIAIEDRLSELDFEFALGTEASTTTLGDVAALLSRWLQPDDPLVDYPGDLAAEPLAGQVLRGFLTGSIDSVLRIHGAAGTRFVIVDYKTNRLAPADLCLEHYDRAAMTAEMRATHYPLQALLYCVALHRFLASRLAGYDPEQHLGGVGYLFVRGLGGTGHDEGTGVFDWYPPAGLVTGLSDLLADRRMR